jgi:hypothetical protein
MTESANYWTVSNGQRAVRRGRVRLGENGENGGELMVRRHTLVQFALSGQRAAAGLIRGPN